MSSALLVRSNFQAEQVAIGVDPDPTSHLGAARPGPTLSAVTKHTERFYAKNCVYLNYDLCSIQI